MWTVEESRDFRDRKQLNIAVVHSGDAGCLVVTHGEDGNSDARSRRKLARKIADCLNSGGVRGYGVKHG